MPGTLFVVATPIGNLEDITGRALRVLRSVAIIAAEDTRHTAHLLSRYAIRTPLTSLHEHSERQKAATLLTRLAQGEDVAVVSDAGTPTVSDPGQRLIRMAIEQGIRTEPVPGPSAVLAALSVSGFLYERFSFLGFPPVRSQARQTWFQSLSVATSPVVFFEAPHRIERTLTEVRKTVGDCQVTLGRELTKAHEELVRGPISEVLRRLKPARGEYTVVLEIGRIANIGRAEAPSDSDMAKLFGEITENGASSRRDAVRAVATKFGISTKEAYAGIQRGLKVGQ